MTGKRLAYLWRGRKRGGKEQALEDVAVVAEFIKQLGVLGALFG